MRAMSSVVLRTISMTVPVQDECPGENGVSRWTRTSGSDRAPRDDPAQSAWTPRRGECGDDRTLAQQSAPDAQHASPLRPPCVGRAAFDRGDMRGVSPVQRPPDLDFPPYFRACDD